MTLRKAVMILRVFIGINFLWFGMLKFIPGMSPAETLATMTIDVLTFGMIPSCVSIKLLAVWEVTIGLGFLVGKYIPFFVRIFMLHMVLTFTPLFLFPNLCFTTAPFALTLVGQYIIKNLVFIMAGMVICLTRKGDEVCSC